MPPFSKYATASNLFSISWEAFLLEAKAYFPTTSIAGGFFMLKRTKKGSIINVGVPLDSSIFFAIKNALISFFLYNKVTTLNRKGEISAKLY